MANKKSSSGKSSKSLDSFNRTQEIYKLLEKGIIESEALLSTAADRPEDDAHVIDLLESTGSPTESSYKHTAKGSAKKSRHAKAFRHAKTVRHARKVRRATHARKAAKKGRKR